ncbi:MAG: hypothetical protein HY296_07575 [Thaumarchaeota archaeon]|nr:hypothetical protein [Nitrososphaerota archaeon]
MAGIKALETALLLASMALAALLALVFDFIFLVFFAPIVVYYVWTMQIKINELKKRLEPKPAETNPP